MKKKLRIWLLVLVVLLVLVGWVVYKQWNNITAVVDSFRYSQEEVTAKLEENNKEIQEYLEKQEDITVRDITEEEMQALLDGVLTEEQVIDRMTGETPSELIPQVPSKTDPKTPTAVAPTTPSGSKQPASSKPTTEKTSGQRVAAAIAKLYITKNDYLGRLDSIEAQVRAEFLALPKEELVGAKRKNSKQLFLSKCLPTVAAWEAECDGAVGAVINEIKAALKESGQSSAIADQIEASYLNEKRLKKSYFINRYMD